MTKATLSLTILFLLAGALSRAQEYESPFVRKSTAPPEENGHTQGSVLDAMEFRGLIKIGGKTQVTLYDPKTQKSYWLAESETGEDGVSLVKYNPGVEGVGDSVIVRQGGMTRTLTIKDAEIITLKSAPRAPAELAPARIEAPQRGPQPRPQSSGIEAASDEEVRERMQRVAEEIRRRRAARAELIEDGGRGNN